MRYRNIERSAQVYANKKLNNPTLKIIDNFIRKSDTKYNKGEKHMAVLQISPKGQILIPKKIRDKYCVKPGAKVLLLETPDGIVIKPTPEDPVDAACGFLEGAFSLTDDLKKEHRKTG